MKKYLTFLGKFKWLIVILVPLLVLLLALNLKDLELAGSYRIWFEKDSKALKDYDHFRSDFSNDNGLTIIFKDENGIFNKKALSSIQRITEALWNMNHIDRVDSITNYQYIHTEPSAPDDVLVDDFIGNLEMSTEEFLKKRKEIAIHDPIVLESYISKDGTTTRIVARLDADVNEDAQLTADVMRDLRVILIPESHMTGYKYWLNGGPVMTETFINIAGHDLKTFTPLVLLIVMALLYLLFRRASGSLIPVMVVLFTFLSVLSLQVILGYKLNNFTVNIPVFIIAIGVADAVHIYSVWLMKRKEGVDNVDAVHDALNKNFVPIMLTSLTTMVGFSTLIFSKVVPISTLGIATSSGAILAFIISVLWMPSVLLLLKKDIKKVDSQEEDTLYTLGYGSFIVRHDKKIILFSALFMMIIGFGLIYTKVDSNTIRYFDKKVEVRKAAEFNMQNLTGPMSYTFIIDSAEADGIKEPAFLQTVEKFYKEYYEAFPVDIRHISSLLDVIKRYNKVLNNQEIVPESRALIAQYLLLYTSSLAQGMEITDQIDFDQKKFRLMISSNIVDTSKDLEMIRFAQKWWAKTPYKITTTGQTVMYAFMQKDVTDTLIFSLSMTLLIVSLMMLLIFKRLKILWILLLPNILPVILVIGVIGWLGMTIDLGVAIAGAIIIGVAVDDTIHFLVKYFEARGRGLSMAETFDEVLHYAGKAIVFTTIVLSGAFSVFAFSTFAPNQNFGIVTATALVLALLTDLLLLPALLSVMDKNEDEKANVNV
jgi:predicted RND superfamily exporter protein